MAHRDDEVNDFMANLLQGSSAPPASKTKRRLGRRAIEMPHDDIPSRKQSYKMRKGVKVMLLASLGVIVFTVLGLVAWKPVSTLLLPGSPFSQEQKDKMGIPLYYPTKLPGSFKIETDSITQPESGVMLYAITDDEGKRINVTLQKQPDGLDLSPLYSSLQDIKEVDTKFGKVKVGTSGENISIANILTGKAWIIISGQKDILDQIQLEDLVNSLHD